MRFSLTLYLLASISFFLDFVDMMVRLYLRRGHTLVSTRRNIAATSVPLDVGDFTMYESRLHLRPFAILASVHNASADLDRFLDEMKPYSKHLWIIDDASTDDTWERLQASGVRCIRGEHNRNKPGALKALLPHLPATIQTVIIIDPDSRFLTSQADFEFALFEFQRSRMAAVCPRITVRGSSVLARLQRLEYALSFCLGRKSLADFSVTSGIAIYRRDALELALSRHSLSVYAEDLENALILLAHGERIYYDGRIIVETDAPATLERLFSQRVGWQFGLMRVYAENWRRVLWRAHHNAVFFYQYVVYIGLFVVTFHSLKLLALPLLAVSALNGVDMLLGTNVVPDNAFTNPLYFISVYIKYELLMAFSVPLVMQRAERAAVWRVLPLYPLYALYQIVPASVGYLNWLALRLWRRRVYHDHYQPASA